jgi:DNA-binding MurR/RpiR family transcriptional regulator
MLHASGSDVVARLAVAQPSLTPKMARLAAFVANNYVRVAFMSLCELAAAAEVTATVMRFPAVLGLTRGDGRSNDRSRLPGVRG